MHAELFPIFLFFACLLPAFVVLIFAILIVYKQRQRRHEQEMKATLLQHQKDVLATKLEANEETLVMISEELHDNFMAMLGVINMQLKSVQHASNTESANQFLQSAISMQSVVIRELRNLSHILNSGMVQQLGFVGAVEKELNYIHTLTGITTTFDCDAGGLALDPKHELLIFRVFHNAVQNILKHAGASQIIVSWAGNGTNGYELSVADDGSGFDKSSFEGKTGLGWTIMQEKAAMLGASLHISSEPGKGSKLILIKEQQL